MCIKCHPRLACAAVQANQGQCFLLLWYFFKWKSVLYKDPVKAVSFTHDKPVQTAQANLGQHLIHMH
jgi:hypothetical protein